MSWKLHEMSKEKSEFINFSLLRRELTKKYTIFVTNVHF